MYKINKVLFEIADAARVYKNKELSLNSFLETIPLRLVETVTEIFNNAVPFTAAEALQIENLEQRRVIIESFKGFEEIAKHLVTNLIDRQVLTKPYLNKPDVYELYDVTVPMSSRWNPDNSMTYRGVRCWCPTTGREYFIKIEPEVNTSTWRTRNVRYTSDAIEAIASTFRVGIRKGAIKSIIRQGDKLFIYVKPRAKNVTCDLRKLTKTEYLNLMIYES